MVTTLSAPEDSVNRKASQEKPPETERHIDTLPSEEADTQEFHDRIMHARGDKDDLDGRGSANNETDTYPEGGLRAWSIVLGSWMSCFGSMGIMNSLGIFQAYLEKHQLHSYSSDKVAWIFGLYTFLGFFSGIQIGPIFDAKGPRVLIVCGAIGNILFMVLLSFCTEYWHFMAVFGVLGGVSMSLSFNPAISIVAHYFNRRRGLATGVASSGASVGGVILPLVFQNLASRVGFAWTTRAIALIELVTFASAAFLIRPRNRPRKKAAGFILPDMSAFLRADFLLASMGIFFMEWGLFAPIMYLSSYALDHGMSTQLSYLLMALINAGAFFGRWVPGYCADRIGRFNTFTVAAFGCLFCAGCLWMPAGYSKPTIITFALLFGFASGSNVSLVPVCIGQLCGLESYGRYYAAAYVMVSISALTGIPIAGAILARSNGEYWGIIAFTMGSYVASCICLIATKGFCCGWNQAKAIF